MLDRERSRGLRARVGFRIRAETFLASIADGGIEVGRRAVDDAEVVFTGAAPAIAAAVYGGQPLAGLERAGLLSVAGDRALAERFVTLFPLPAKVERTA
jgi:hypothetical protein